MGFSILFFSTVTILLIQQVSILIFNIISEMKVVNHKRILYVGNLADPVKDDILYEAFVPFGEIIKLQIATDFKQKSKGFGFVEYELKEDAQHAMDNMNQSELYGRVLNVNIARPDVFTRQNHNKAIWETNPDSYFEKDQDETSEQKQEEEDKTNKEFS